MRVMEEDTVGYYAGLAMTVSSALVPGLGLMPAGVGRLMTALIRQGKAGIFNARFYIRGVTSFDLPALPAKLRNIVGARLTEAVERYRRPGSLLVRNGLTEADLVAAPAAGAFCLAGGATCAARTTGKQIPWLEAHDAMRTGDYQGASKIFVQQADEFTNAGDDIGAARNLFHAAFASASAKDQEISDALFIRLANLLEQTKQPGVRERANFSHPTIFYYYGNNLEAAAAAFRKLPSGELRGEVADSIISHANEALHPLTPRPTIYTDRASKLKDLLRL